MGVNWAAAASKLDTMLRHGRPAKGTLVVARQIRPYPISRYARRGMPAAHDWVAAPTPEWIADYESADIQRRWFLTSIATPLEIPAAVLSSVEHHQGEWLFYTWSQSGTGAQLQWASPRYSTPWAGWQVFMLRGALRVIQQRQRIVARAGTWLLRGFAAVGLAVGGPLVAWWIINHLLESG